VPDLVAVIAGDNKPLKAALKAARKDLAAFNDNIAAVGSTLSMTMTPAILGLGGAALKIAGDFEQSQIAFTTMLGSAEKAEAFLKDLAKFAANTPFDLPGLESAAKKMLAFGFASEDVIPMLTAVGDAVSAVGGGKDVIAGVTTALGQMRAKAKVSAEEMAQLAERGIPAWEILAEKMGVDVPKAMELAGKGAIDGIKGVDALVAGLNERFAGTMEKQANTLIGQVDRLVDESGLLLRKLGTILMPFFQPIADFLSKVIAGVSDMLDWFSRLDPSIQAAVVGFVAFLAVLGPILVVIGGIAAGLASLAAVSTGVIASVVGVSAAVVAGGGALTLYWDQLKGVVAWLQGAWGVAWLGAVFVLELVKVAFSAFMETDLGKWIETTVKVVALGFSGMLTIVKNAVGSIVDFVVDKLQSLLLAFEKLPGKVGNAARNFRVAILDFRATDFSAAVADPVKAAGDEIEKAGSKAQTAGPMFGGVAGFMRETGKAAKDAKTPVAEFVKAMSTNAATDLADALKEAKENIVSIASVAGDAVAPAIELTVVAAGKLEGVLFNSEKLAKGLAEGLEFASNAAKALGFTLSTDVAAGLESSKKAYEQIKLAAQVGLATERDVNLARIALLEEWKSAALAGVGEWSKTLEAELQGRMEQTVVTTDTSIEAWKKLAGTIKSEIGQALTDVITGTATVGEAFAALGDAVLKAITDTIVKGLVDMTMKLFEGDEAVGKLIASFKKFIGIFTGGGGPSPTGLPKKPGGGKGGAGDLGSFTGVLNALDAVVSIITSIIGLFIQRRMEKDIARIEVTSREIKAEVMNHRADQWTRHVVMLDLWADVQRTLWSAKDELVKQTPILEAIAKAAGGLVKTDTGPTEVEMGPIWQALTESIQRGTEAAGAGIQALLELTRSTIVIHLATQTFLLEGIMSELQTMNGALGGKSSGKGGVTLPPTALQAQGPGALFGTLVLAGTDPQAVGRQLTEFLRARGSLRTSGTFELGF